jgi:hypothetical protein
VPDVLVGKGTPVITWPAPAPITYSFPVNSTQLNATANTETLAYEYGVDGDQLVKRPVPLPVVVPMLGLKGVY